MSHGKKLFWNILLRWKNPYQNIIPLNQSYFFHHHVSLVILQHERKLQIIMPGNFFVPSSQCLFCNFMWEGVAIFLAVFFNTAKNRQSKRLVIRYVKDLTAIKGRSLPQIPIRNFSHITSTTEEGGIANDYGWLWREGVEPLITLSNFFLNFTN